MALVLVRDGPIFQWSPGVAGQDTWARTTATVLRAQPKCWCVERRRRPSHGASLSAQASVLMCAARQDVWARSTVAMIVCGIKALVRGEEVPPKAPAAPQQPPAAPSRIVMVHIQALERALQLGLAAR